ncbi:hypothetical protein F2P81_012148 [Scophthalmus maximus]|uniref:FAM65 N-terminal domain-containing protein n=1 Tax=Scophthalmus maximus TaxID=52904 RepID=A0A6A4SR68_SCOMX|nr:hypothetical protein F2P81_012148 [Scophthalmus maximus]
MKITNGCVTMLSSSLMCEATDRLLLCPPPPLAAMLAPPLSGSVVVAMVTDADLLLASRCGKTKTVTTMPPPQKQQRAMTKEQLLLSVRAGSDVTSRTLHLHRRNTWTMIQDDICCVAFYSDPVCEMFLMSVKLRFDSPSDGGLLHRSRSFTGFSSLSGRRRPSSGRNSLRSKASSGGKSRTHLSPSRGGGAVCSLQPEQVDSVFQALRKGLKEFLDGHQAEMDFLSSQQRETKRNSRLAFLYDLEKELRALERYIRRLEFQISKVEELYETYCVQWRLCEGAVNMKRAFALSPSTRASRESLLELGRNHRHSLQDMSVMEGELEILLGELHIKMKGLIGFARLCPGDQYEVVVRLGRQRWRIRGRIESDDTQSWDEEEMVFLPHIHHNFEIKVQTTR